MQVADSRVRNMAFILLFAVLTSKVMSVEMQKFCHPNPRIISCENNIPCLAYLCPKITPNMCPSQCVMKCGCCDVCLEYYGKGEQCRFFVPTNAICAPGLYCGPLGVCIPKDNSNDCKKYTEQCGQHYQNSPPIVY